MKTLLLLFLMNFANGGEISQVTSGDVISATKINEVIDGVNNAGGLIKDGTKTKCAEWRMSDNTYKASLVPISCDTKVAIGLSQRDGAYEIGSGSNLSNCQAYRDHLLYTGQGDGVYWIDPDGSGGPIGEYKIYCDMDGSFGWTLIFSSQSAHGQLANQGTTEYDSKLSGITPNGSMTTIWVPFETVTATRFSCDSGKNGTIDFSSDLVSSTPYNGWKSSTHIADLVIGNYIYAGDAPPNNQYSTDPEFIVYTAGYSLKGWGTENEYPNSTPATDDFCNGISQSLRTSLPSSSTIGKAYFYIWVR